MEENQSWFEKYLGGRTFILALACLALSFCGSYLNMFPPEVFTNVLYAVMGGYSLKSGSHAVAGAI